MSEGDRSTFDETGMEGQRLAVGLGEALRQRGWTCATAESCSGGLIGHLITSIAGSSDYYRGGVIAYANEVKVEFLDVSSRTLDAVGAVSAQVAGEMARGARGRLAADVAISTTGIAGPGGATERKPVGLIYIGVVTPQAEEILELRLQGDRAGNIRVTAHTGLQLAMRLINEER